jgi:hypothetical protein
MMNNDNITIYNKSVSPTTRAEVWNSYQITKVTWENTKAANVIRSGLLEADRYTIYIPLARGMNYLSPLAWRALASKTGKWTLQIGDVIVNGLVSDTISASFTISDLKKKYDDVATIRSVDRMDKGMPALRHWQVGAN